MFVKIMTYKGQSATTTGTGKQRNPSSYHLDPVINLCQASIDVPKEEESERGHGAHHAVFFVLVNPFVAVFRQKFVRAKGGVDESVDEGGSQVLTSRIHLLMEGGRRGGWDKGEEGRK